VSSGRKSTQQTARRKEKTLPQSTPAVQESAPVQYSDFKRGVIAVFIAFHIFAITIWAIPADSRVVNGARQLVQPYIVWAGVSQTWDMFAPNPKDVNRFLKAVVITEHRHPYVYSFPRMELLSLPERYQKERYRKFEDFISQPQFAPLLPDVAVHIARLYDSPSDRSDRVMIIKYELRIDPSDEYQSMRSPKPTVIYDDYVERSDLR
jgi:hypothetical protein